MPSKNQTKIKSNQSSQAALLLARRVRPGYSAATEYLSDPKIKATARHRRKNRKFRQIRLVSTETPKPQTDRQQDKVISLSMQKLVALIAKTQRRIDKATRLLADMAVDSMFRQAVEATKVAEQNLLIIAQTEATRRATLTPDQWRAIRKGAK